MLAPPNDPTTFAQPTNCAWWNLACKGAEHVANSGLSAITKSIACLGDRELTRDQSAQLRRELFGTPSGRGLGQSDRPHRFTPLRGDGALAHEQVRAGTRVVGSLYEIQRTIGPALGFEQIACVLAQPTGKLGEPRAERKDLAAQ